MSSTVELTVSGVPSDVAETLKRRANGHTSLNRILLEALAAEAAKPDLSDENELESEWQAFPALQAIVAGQDPLN